MNSVVKQAIIDAICEAIVMAIITILFIWGFWQAFAWLVGIN